MPYEYAVLTWVSDKAKNNLAYSHRTEGKDVHGSLVDVLRRLGNDGWEMVAVTRVSMGNLESKLYFKRLLRA